MAVQTPSELLQWLADNQFLPLPQVEELRATLPPFPDRHALVKELIRRNWLTPFQANQILTDKAQTLVMEDYRLLERLGEGAMGQVFKAWNVRLGRFVAVKMIHKNHLASAKAMDRFRQEMQAAARLHHPNIVLVRDAGEVDGRPFMVMDYFDGTNLAKLIKDGGPLPIHVGCDYVRQAALGLQNAFEHHVVHRDIKPGNLLLTRGTADEPGVVKILDFGLARAVGGASDEGRLTQVGRIIGTIDYIAPEQVENAQNAGVGADIYSLGCTLYFLLTGKPPFPGTKFEEKVYGRLLGTVPSLRAERPEVPPVLDAVLARIMARTPEERYQTPAELAQALGAFCNPQMLAQAAAMPTPLPLAQPVASSGPPLASPVAPPTEPSPFAFQAQPAPAPAVDDAFAFSTNAAAAAPTHTDPPPPDAAPVDIGLPASRSRTRPSAGKFPMKWIAAIAGSVLFVLLLILVTGWLLRGGGGGKKLAYPGGSLRVMPVAALKLKEGERKPFIVQIQRKGFDGPVTVQFKNLPDGVSAQSLLIAEKADRGQTFITASYSIGAMKASVKLFAKAEELEAEEVFSLTVEAARK